MAERLEALLPADGVRALVVRLEQLRAQGRAVDEEMSYTTDARGRVVELRVTHSYPVRA